MRIKKILCLFLLVVLNYGVYPQTDSIAHYKKALETKRATIDFTPKDTTYIKLLIALSSYYKHSNTDTLAVLAEEALELSQSINYDLGVVEALSNLAIYELFKGNFQKSIRYSHQALENLDVKAHPNLAANSYNMLGQTNFTLGNHPEAYKNFYQSLVFAEMAKNQVLIKKINANLGTLFYLLEDYDEALRFYEVVLNSFSKTDTSVTKASVQASLGCVYVKKNDTARALKLLNHSLPILEKANVQEILPVIYMAYGDLYFTSAIYDKALYYFEKANSQYETSNDILNKAYASYGLGISYLKLDKLEDSERFLYSSLNLYESVNFINGMENSYRYLYELFKKKNAIDKALYYLEKTQSFSDSIYNEKSIRDISMLKAKNEFEREKAQLQEQNKKELALKKSHIQWTALGLAFAILIAILISQANRTHQKLNKELALKSQNLSKKQEELNKINTNQDKLFSIVGHDLRGPILSLKQLLSMALADESGVQHFYRFGPKLKKDVDHIHFTLDNLLNWGLTQMQGEPLYPVQINVKKVVLEIVILFSEVLNKKSIQINNGIIDDLTIVADTNHFTIVLRNLISNAVKFTPEHGQIWISSFKEDISTVIQVKDNGIGMSKEVLKRIFNSKEHYTTFGTNNERGTGLGLLLCKEMVLKNNGSIWAESYPEKGSTFFIKFPREILT